MVNIHVLRQIIIGQGKCSNAKHIGKKYKKQSASKKI